MGSPDEKEITDAFCLRGKTGGYTRYDRKFLFMARDTNEYDSFEILTDIDNLYEAHLKCRKGKRWKDSVASFDLKAMENIIALRDSLEDGTYKISPYNCFTINERGKVRDIKSVKYQDRIVQKVLKDKILEPAIFPTFTYENGASQKYKGTDFHLQLLKRHLREYINKHGTDGYVAVYDMRHYFDKYQYECHHH